MSNRLLSLAAGCVLDLDPVATVEAAAAAGFDAAGLWFDPTTWTAGTTSGVRKALAASGITALDIEPLIYGRGELPVEALLDAAAATGAQFVLACSGPATVDEFLPQFESLCALAAERAPQATITLEFLPIFTVNCLASAIDVVTRVGAPNSGILVDTLHLSRSGSQPGDLAAAATARPGLVPYLQLADAPGAVPGNRTALRDEALNGRLLCGDGALPLDDVVRAVSGVPLSVELRSAPLVQQYPDPFERACVIYDSFERMRTHS
jgi:sugar phosphate isomerase/epimerase